MYWFLIGHVAGLSLALVTHALFARGSDWIWVGVILIALGILMVAADVETLFPDEWKKQIAAGLATGQLTRRLCFLLGLVLGIPVYVSQWFLWIRLMNEPDSIHLLRIVLAGLSAAINVYVGWYFLTRRPKTRQ